MTCSRTVLWWTTCGFTLAFVGLALFHSAGLDRVDAGEKKPPVVKQIKLKGLKLGFVKGGSALRPKVLDDVQDLAKAVPNMDLVKKITKQVDFKQYKLLYFRWAGSGQDRLNYKVKDDKGIKVVFQYRRGLTRDLRPHRYLFAVRRDAKWSVKTVPFKFKR